MYVSDCTYKLLLVEGYVLTRRLEFIDEPCVPWLAIDPDRPISHPRTLHAFFLLPEITKTPGVIPPPSFADPLSLAPQGQLTGAKEPEPAEIDWARRGNGGY